MQTEGAERFFLRHHSQVKFIIQMQGCSNISKLFNIIPILKIKENHKIKPTDQNDQI